MPRIGFVVVLIRSISLSGVAFFTDLFKYSLL